jgi:hypothetical protein
MPMAIDLTSERLITPTEYTRMRPPGRNGRPMHVATAYRHIFPGVRGVRLEHVKIGGNTYTSVEAVQRFADRLTLASERAVEAAPAPRSPRARRRAVERAEAELSRLGV